MDIRYQRGNTRIRPTTSGRCDWKPSLKRTPKTICQTKEFCSWKFEDSKHRRKFTVERTASNV